LLQQHAPVGIHQRYGDHKKRGNRRHLIPTDRGLLTPRLLQGHTGLSATIGVGMRGLVESIARMGLLKCERGATAVEYGLILALVVLAMIAALSNIATKTNNMWNNVATEVLAH
jgi:pilus assembly protein Flp/PilA